MNKENFLRAQGWSGEPYSLIGEDWGPRRYFRVPLEGGGSAILMDSVPDDAPESAPGHKISDFIKMDAALRGVGLHAPEILAAIEKEGLLLLEDMGDTRFYDALEAGADPAGLYTLATDVLGRLRDTFPDNDLNLPLYKDSHVNEGRRRVVDWYMPCALKRENETGLAQSYLEVWNKIEAKLPPYPEGVVHIDYHVQNLMWLPEETGLNRCGILDFQGALWGPLAYDLVNLLEDIRRDVPEDIRAEMMARYTQNVKDKEAFQAWYRVLGTQFHCRVIGQVLKLALRSGKPEHLKNMERIQKHLREGLEHPLLKPLQDWFGAQGVDFNEVVELSDEFIGSDAF